ncbi:MAG: hypothetical protein ACKV0T_25255, partial [Planctomycetales bacterium]
SGKNKHKSKTKTSTLASVRLFPKKKRQEGVAQVAGQARNLVRLPQWGQLKSVTATGEELSLVARTSAEWSVRRQTPNTQYDGLELVGKMLLSLYQVMHVAEK